MYVLCVVCVLLSLLIYTIAQHDCSTISSAARKVSLFRFLSFSHSRSRSLVHSGAAIRFKNCSLFPFLSLAVPFAFSSPLPHLPATPLAIGSHKRASTLIYMFIHTYIYHLARAPSHEATLKIGSRFALTNEDTTSRSAARSAPLVARSSSNARRNQSSLLPVVDGPARFLYSAIHTRRVSRDRAVPLNCLQ